MKLQKIIATSALTLSILGAMVNANAGGNSTDIFSNATKSLNTVAGIALLVTTNDAVGEYNTAVLQSSEVAHYLESHFLVVRVNANKPSASPEFLEHSEDNPAAVELIHNAGLKNEDVLAQVDTEHQPALIIFTKSGQVHTKVGDLVSADQALRFMISAKRSKQQ